MQGSRSRQLSMQDSSSDGTVINSKDPSKNTKNLNHRALDGSGKSSKVNKESSLLP